MLKELKRIIAEEPMEPEAAQVAYHGMNQE